MKFSLGRLFQGILCSGFILGFAQVAWGQSEAGEKIYHLRDMHTHPWFWEVLASALVGWILGMVKGFSGTKDWLEKYWTRPPTYLVFLGDVLVFVFVGAYFGTAIYNPDKFLEALAAGLTWPIAVGALSTKVE